MSHRRYNYDLHHHSSEDEDEGDRAEHEHGHDYAKANAEHFDKESKNQGLTEAAAELAQLSAPYILKQYAFDKETTEVLDFAAGWGLVSKQIIPHAKSILGVDISQGMVDVYNDTGSKEGTGNMKAVRVELKGEDGELDGQKFDVVTCNMAYHHFADIRQMTKILAGFLKPGGKLIVSDFRTGGEGVRKDFSHVVAHDGMSEDVLRDAFTYAGLTDIVIDDGFDYSSTLFDRVMHVFFTVGSKA